MASKSSLRAVNLLFLLVLCLEAANAFFMWLPQYVRLILNEALFVFLPAYLYLRLSRQPLRPRVRWHWPGWRVAGLAVLIGAGLYPLSAIGAGLLTNLLGYSSLAAPADVLPDSVLMGVLAVVAYAVMAPLCEEFLFRGVIQPVYETRGPGWAVWFVGLLFIVFHLSLLQGLSIVLLALALGYVNYRTRSLPASVLTHVGANGLAALVLTQDAFHTNVAGWIVSLPALLGGLLVALLAAAALTRLTHPPAPPARLSVAGVAPTGGRRPAWLAAGWPLLLAALLYLPVIGAEFYFSRAPAMAAEPLRVSPAGWRGAPQWKYEIRNVLDEVVGEGECQLTLRDATAELACTSQTIAYEAQLGNSYFSSSGGERMDRLHWRLEDGQLIAGSTALDLSGSSYISNRQWTLEDGFIQVHVRENGGEWTSMSLALDSTGLSGDLLVVDDYTWPWQLAGLSWEQGAGGKVVRFSPYTWRNASGDNGPLAEAQVVTVQTLQQVSVPAGSFTAWQVTLGRDKVAWFDPQTLTLLKFFNGVETWALK